MICSLAHSHSFTRSLTHALALTDSCTHPPTHSCTHPPTHSCTHPPTHSCSHPPTHSRTHSLTPAGEAGLGWHRRRPLRPPQYVLRLTAGISLIPHPFVPVDFHFRNQLGRNYGKYFYKRSPGLSAPLPPPPTWTQIYSALTLLPHPMPGPAFVDLNRRGRCTGSRPRESRQP